MMGAMTFVACSSDNDEISNEIPAAKKMTLKATVEQTVTRASFTDNNGSWTFSFANNDIVTVTNTEVEDYYKFTKNGDVFENTDNAVSTQNDATWYGFFPSETINLTNQDGTLDNVANLYALVGSATIAGGETSLAMNMAPQVAILKVANNKAAAFNVYVKAKNANNYVSSLKYDKSTHAYTVSYTETATSACNVASGTTKYIVVPAGVELQFVDDNGSILTQTSKATGLSAGYYYNVNTSDYVEIGGIKWAKYNLGANADNHFLGDYYAWGETSTHYTGTFGNHTWKEDKKGYNSGTYTVPSVEALVMSTDKTMYTLGSSVDAATVNLGKDWRMPTNADFKALIDACNTGDAITVGDGYSKTKPIFDIPSPLTKGIYRIKADTDISGISGVNEYNGQAGLLFVDENKNKLFLPMAKLINGEELSSFAFLRYWTSNATITTSSSGGWFNSSTTSYKLDKSYYFWYTVGESTTLMIVTASSHTDDSYGCSIRPIHI